MRLEGKVAAITGGSQGIGRAIALLFAKEGAAIGVGDIDADRVMAVAEEIRAQPGRAFAMPLDVGESGQVRDFVERIVAEFGRLDVMVANAGIAGSQSFLEHSEEHWHRVLRVNLHGVFHACQAAARYMVGHGGGRIITIASINGFRGVENLASYNVSKAGVVALTKTMAVELAQHNVFVNAIAPAQIDTRLTRAFSEEDTRKRRARIPIGRYGQPDEVARAALFLASEEASFITGHTLAVDGGYLAGGLWTSKAPSR